MGVTRISILFMTFFPSPSLSLCGFCFLSVCFFVFFFFFRPFILSPAWLLSCNKIWWRKEVIKNGDLWFFFLNLQLGLHWNYSWNLQFEGVWKLRRSKNGGFISMSGLVENNKAIVVNFWEFWMQVWKKLSVGWYGRWIDDEHFNVFWHPWADDNYNSLSNKEWWIFMVTFFFCNWSFYFFWKPWYNDNYHVRPEWKDHCWTF